MSHFLELLRIFLGALKSGQLPQQGTWTYFLLAALVAVEGPVATLLGAAAASAGLMKAGWVFICASAGNLTADLLWYSVGYRGKVAWIHAVANRFGVDEKFLEYLEAEMNRHAARILFLCKLTLSMMLPALLAAGMVKAPIKRWLPALFAGEMIWTGSLVIIGFYTTEAVKRVERGIEYAALGVTVAFVLFLVLVVRRLFKKYTRQDLGD